MGRAVPFGEGKDEGGVGVGIGGVEVANDYPGRPVLLHREKAGYKLGGIAVGVRGGIFRVGARIHLGLVPVPVSIGVDVVRVGA